MKAGFTVLLLMLIIIGCDPKTTVKESQINLEPNRFFVDREFDFLIAKGSFPEKGFACFNIPFLLVNTSLDTLYLASTTCYGPSHFLETDTTQLQFFMIKDCLGSSNILIESQNKS